MQGLERRFESAGEATGRLLGRAESAAPANSRHWSGNKALDRGRLALSRLVAFSGLCLPG
jgi:hypothetical protein